MPYLETGTIPDTVPAIVPDKPERGDLVPGNRTPTHRRLIAVCAVLGVFALGGCATGVRQARSGAKLYVVAAENMWGSIVAQLGGDKVAVTNIIDNPATDPHDYEPTAADARAVATAQLVIVNGVGYDGWASKLLAANPTAGRRVITVGKLVGVPNGGNPHRWYDPDDVRRVVVAVAADLEQLDRSDAAYFASRRSAFETTGLAAYNGLIASIKKKYAGTPVGASESIFSMLAPALGLTVLTPPTFLKAISEGTDPTAADKATIDSQIKHHAIKAYVYNSQNATPDVRAQVNAAKAAGIPVTTITETLEPANTTFQAWQSDQLRALAAALAQAATAATAAKATR